MTATLLYDADCGFCRWSLSKVLKWDRRKSIRPVALQDPEADQLVPGLDPEERMSSWHLVTEEGRVHSAGAAAAPLLDLLPGGRALAAVARAAPGVTERMYQLIARNRGRLGRLLGEDKCAVSPTRRPELARERRRAGATGSSPR